MTTSELLRLACIYAESDRESYLDSISGTGDVEQIKETKEFLEAISKYRLKRWGKTEFEVRCENSETVNVFDLLKRPK